MPILITTIRRYREQARNHSPSAARVVSASLRRARRMGLMTGAMLMVVAGCLSFASQASAVSFCGTNGVESVVGNVYSCTYTTPGEDTFNVPLFVTNVHVVAVGQTGGSACAFENTHHAGYGGHGARVAASLPVTQPTLFVEVPPSPNTPPPNEPGCDAQGDSQIVVVGGGGGNGNGLAPGGGASVVQRCSDNTSCMPTGAAGTDPRLVVAGGGGGGAFNDINGGDAGTGGNPVCNPGQSGETGPNATDGGGGSGGGCQSFGVGGHGGTGPNGISTDGLPGDNGWIVKGGWGGDHALNPVPTSNCDHPWRGAGGGDGFWGGGGGGGAAYCSGGGGGGGSSYAEPVATNVSMTLAPLSAPPSVTVSWYQPVDREYQFLTGRAFGLSFTQSPPNPAFSLTSADTGFISTSQSYTFSAPCVPFLSEPVDGNPGSTTISEHNVCALVKTTGGNQLQSSSIGYSSTGLLIIKIQGLPIVRARVVISGSKTTCAGSTGTTFISFLAIGGDVVISHPQVVAPNTHLTVGPFSVNLNEQTPFTLPADRGLIVDAITLSFGPPSSVTGHLIVASSESDIGDCPGQVHVN